MFWVLFYHVGWGFGVLILLSFSWLFDWAKNGRGSMDYLRRKAGLFSENAIQWQNVDLLDPYVHRRVMFLAVPNVTGLPLLWSFGWHVNNTLAKMDVLYAVPAVLLWVPFLREFLIASGAVEDNQDVLLRLMKKEGRAVCYSPGEMKDVLTNQSFDRMTVKSPSEEFVSSLMEKGVVIVPVVFLNELKRYPPLLKTPDESYLEKNPWYGYFLAGIKLIRTKSLEVIGYPFPLIFGWNRKEKIITLVGAPIDTNLYDATQVAMVRKTIETGWAALGNNFDELLLIED